MTDTINVQGLSEEDIRILKEIVEHFRRKKTGETRESPEEMHFQSWDLGVRNNLSRKDIYDHE